MSLIQSGTSHIVRSSTRENDKVERSKPQNIPIVSTYSIL